MENCELKIECNTDDDGEIFEPLEYMHGKYVEKLKIYKGKFKDFIEKWDLKDTLNRFIYVMIGIAYVVYFGFAISPKYGYPPNDLLVLTILLTFALLIQWGIIAKPFKYMRKYLENNGCTKKVAKIANYVQITICIIIVIAFITLMVLERSEKWYQSFIGILILLAILVATSKNPLRINYKLILSSSATEMVMGMIILRTQFGETVLRYISEKLKLFLNSSNEGSRQVFGSLYKFAVDFSIVKSNATDRSDIIVADATRWSSIAIQITSSIIFLSSIINLLYYLRIMQKFINFSSSILKWIIGSSPTESISVTANTLLGMTEVPLALKPFLQIMTPSELHVLMTAGLASVAGSVLGAYISLGVPANLLLGASVLVAPMSFLVSKISYPEEFHPKATRKIVKGYEMGGEDSSVIQSILSGAVIALKVCAAIIASLISVTSLLYLADRFVEWTFSMIRIRNISLSNLFGYLFYPFMWLIGISKHDCAAAGQIFGKKTFLNEFIAFMDLKKIQETRENLKANGSLYHYVCGLKEYEGSDSMIFDERSLKILTYSLCGFANLASMGMLSSVLTNLAPKRTIIFRNNILRAFICAVVVNMLTAAFAGLLLNDSMYNQTLTVKQYCLNLEKK